MDSGIATPVNRLTSSIRRAIRPDLSAEEVSVIRFLCRQAPHQEVVYRGRRYWADPNGDCFVVAWDDGEKVSGDPI